MFGHSYQDIFGALSLHLLFGLAVMLPILTMLFVRPIARPTGKVGVMIFISGWVWLCSVVACFHILFDVTKLGF